MLEQLISEHRVALSIARELVRSEPGEDRESWLRDLADLLAEHLQAEERFVGPLLEQYPREGIGPPLDLRAAQLGSALGAVRRPDLAAFGAATATLVDALQLHVAYTEYEVFPALVGPAPSPPPIDAEPGLGFRGAWDASQQTFGIPDP